MNDDEITADDVRAGLHTLLNTRDLARLAIHTGNMDAHKAGIVVLAATIDARNRRLSERTMLEAEARADAEREDLR